MGSLLYLTLDGFKVVGDVVHGVEFVGSLEDPPKDVLVHGTVGVVVVEPA